MALIEMTGIRKHFRDGSERLNEVLRGIDLTVERGDFLAIKGASGSGKTTLLSVLGLLIRPDGGEYRLDGNRLFEDEAWKISFCRRWLIRRRAKGNRWSGLSA